MHPLIGRTLGTYRIDALLGKGGMGEVFKAYQASLDRPVALKMLYPNLLSDTGMEARFRQEAQAAARLRHPHIVQVYDFGEADGTFYMVMELLDGPSLRAELRRLSAAREYLPLLQVADIVRQIADALDYAHARGVLHRDIKPDNIMFASLGGTAPASSPPALSRVVLTDFGLAKLAGTASLTRTGHIAGTPSYMSPEQCEGRPLDARSDIYSLGVVLYELLTGQVPFAADTAPVVIYQHIHAQPPNPRELRPDLAPAVIDVVMLALAKRPDDRYASAGALARDLDLALHVTPGSRLMPGTAPAQAGSGVATAHALPTQPDHPTEVLREPSWMPIADGSRGRFGTLQITLAEGGQRSLRLDGSSTTIGRSRDNDLLLSGDRVSRQHARITCGPAGCQIEDLGSTNGTFIGNERLLPHYPRQLADGDVISIGGHMLRFVAPHTASEAVLQSAPDSGRATGQASTLALVLTPQVVAAQPGNVATVTAVVQNRGHVVDTVSVVVEGLPDGWYHITPEQVPIWPSGGQESVVLVITPPRDGTATAGHYPFRVRVISQANAQHAVEATGTLEVRPFFDVRAELRPRRVYARGRGKFRLSLTNAGNAPVQLALIGQDDEESLRFGMPGTVKVEPGGQTTIRVRISRRRGRWFGRVERNVFTITIHDATQPYTRTSPAALVNGELVSRGRVPAWVTVLVLVLALAAGALAGLYTYAEALLPPLWANEVRNGFTQAERALEPLLRSWGAILMREAGAVTAEVNAPIGLYLRSGPAIAYPSIGQFRDATRLTLYEQHNGWFRVRGPQGEEGWVAGEYLHNFSAAPASVPQLAAPAPVPAIGFRVDGVRVGTADGQRVRVVVDLERVDPSATTLGLFEVPDPGPRTRSLSIYVRAQHTDAAPQYLSQAADELIEVAVEPAQGRDGTIVRVTPKARLWLRPAFLTPDPPRIVVDLCEDDDCPQIP